MGFSGKTVLVTGGSSGIGEAMSKRFLKEGAHVIVFDINKPSYKVNFCEVDIRDESQIIEAFEGIKRLDILVNNAGIYLQAPVEKTTKKQLDAVVDVNLKGTYLCSKHAIPLIKKSKGTIINISSGLAIIPEPESPAYCATKAAIVMLTKCMAQEYASQGVRVNAVLPGPIDTPLLREAFKSKKAMEDYKKLNPMRRIGKPDDIVNIVVFLASDKASYVTGGIYSVDGGESTSSIYSK